MRAYNFIAMTKQQEHYLEVLIEAIGAELTQVHEAVSALLDVPRRLGAVENKLDKMSSEHDVFFLALQETNKQVNNHEHRITKLETA